VRRPIVLVLVVSAFAAVGACSSSSDGGGIGDAGSPVDPVGTTATSSAITAEPDDVPTTIAVEPPITASTVAASTESPTASGPPTSRGAGPVVLADRPYDLVVPTTYDPTVPMPLVIGLHGYTSNGQAQKAYFGLAPLAEERGFLLAHPDGTVDRAGQPFWNATDACCDLFGSAVDDSTYLTAVIDDIVAQYNVDPKRIFVTGLSNGGFMSHRMACDHADRIAAIVSVAGAVFADPELCRPSEPVNVVEIHGTSDKTVQFGGDSILGHPYPGAATTVSTWAALNGCGSLEPAAEGAIDLVADIDGDETQVGSFAGCPDGGSVELWTMNSASHVPDLSPTFASTIVDWMFAHPDP
jgi:polyhydroxybutyrate depolymerase